MRLILLKGRCRLSDISECTKNPYFSLEYNDTGYLDVSKKLEKAVVARQAAPIVLEHVGQRM